MTLANTIVQLLYLHAVYSWGIAASGRGGRGSRDRVAGLHYGVAVLSYLAMVAQTRYKYPTGEPVETSVIELLGDVYASPVRGTRASLDGELIGRGRVGYRFYEDLTFQDDTGLMYLKYDHWLPVFSDFLFSVRRVPELIDERVSVAGWYLGGVSPWPGLGRLRIDDEEIGGFIHLGGYVVGGILLLVGVTLLIVGL